MPDPATSTSQHVRRAGSGVAQSVHWLILRFSPLMEMKARMLIEDHQSLRRLVEPADVVQEVWMAVLRKLPSFDFGNRSAAASFVSYLMKSVVNRVTDAIRRHIRARAAEPAGERSGPSEPQSDPLAEVPARSMGPATLVLVSDEYLSRKKALDEAVAQLPAEQWECVRRHILEGDPHAKIARALQINESASQQRCRRGIQRLAELLPDSLFQDL